MNKHVELSNYKRSTELYLRALWGRGFNLCDAESDNEYGSPYSYIVDNNIHLCQQISLKNNQEIYYRATAAHAALHSIYSKALPENSGFNLMQRTLIGLVEDLRVELLAIREFPGLRRLWLAFHTADNLTSVDAQILMLRLSRSVLDPQYIDDHQWVNKGKKIILGSGRQLHDTQDSVSAGLSLANDLGQMRLPLNSGRYEQMVSYRDDNRYLWHQTKEQSLPEITVQEPETSGLYNNHLKEKDHGILLELSAKEAAGSKAHFVRESDQAVLEYRQFVNNETIKGTLYPEWDYRIQVLKKDWCNVLETKAKDGPADKVDKIFNSHRIVLNRLRYLAKQLQAQTKQRIRKVESGDDLDLDPAIDAMVSLRNNTMPDMRVCVRNDYRKVKELAITILLDLSESTNAIVSGTDMSISRLIRDAVLLLGETLSIAGDQFSVFGFSSVGRHEVNFINFKNFDQTFEECKLSLAEIKGQHSTRLGAAIRHSSSYLSRQPEKRKILLVITDGAPSDIDVYDTQYLKQDSRDAIRSLAKYGIKPFCINLDSRSSEVTEYIFGRGHFQVLNSLIRLPEVLSSIYIKHVRH